MSVKRCLLMTLYFVTICIICSTVGLGQKAPSTAGDAQKKISRLEVQLEQTQDDLKRIELLKKICSAYLNVELKKAQLYAQQGIELSKKTRNKKGHADFLYFMGGISDRQGKKDIALRYYTDSLEIYKNLEKKDEMADTSFNIAIIYQNKGNNRLALDFHKKGLELYGKLGNKKNMSMSYNNIAIIYHNQGDYSRAEKYYGKSLEIYRQLGDKRGIARYYNNMAVISQHRGDMDRALQFHLEGKKIREEIGDHRGMAISYNNIAVIYQQQGKYKQALQYYTKCIEIAKKIGNDKWTAMFLNNIGIIHKKQGDYRKALEFYEMSLKLGEKVGDKQGISRSYKNMGIVNKELGQYRRALELYYKALAIEEEMENKRGIAGTLSNIGNIYLMKYDYDRALEFLRKGLAIREELKDKRGLANSYLGIGKVYIELEDFNSALEFLDRSLGLMEAVGDKSGVTGIYTSRGDIFLKQGKISDALTSYLNAKRINEELGEQLRQAKVLLGLGTCYTLKGQKETGLEHLKKALDIAQSINNQHTVKDAARQLSSVYAELRRFEQAYRYHALFKEKSDELFNKERIEKLTRLEMEYEFDKQQKQQALVQKEKDLQAAAILDRQKAILFVSSGFSLLLIMVLYVLYRVRTRANKKLNHEIHERKAAEDELLKSQKMETVGILAGGIAHDFNNILAIILGNISLLSETIGEKEPEKFKLIKDAEASTMQAVELVNNFLTMSSSGWLTSEPVVFSKILIEMENTIPGLVDGSYNYNIYNIPKDLKLLKGDERQLRQAFSVLLLNACDAVAGNSDDRKIKISAKNLIIPVGNSRALKEGEYVSIVIEDNGKGIAPELLGKIFDPYFSTKERGAQKGMGLGLALCYTIVKRHGGHIEISSQLQKGTTVELILPTYNS